MKQDTFHRTITLDDIGMIAVVRKLIRHRQAAMDVHRRSGRPDLAAREGDKIEVLRSYLPTGVQDDEDL